MSEAQEPQGEGCYSPQEQARPTAGACRFAPLDVADQDLSRSILSDSLISNKMASAWASTQRTGNEHGFLIYRTPYGFGGGEVHQGDSTSLHGNYMEFLGRKLGKLSLPIDAGCQFLQ